MIPQANETIESSPNPQAIAVVMSVLRWLLTTIGAMGWWSAHFTQADTYTFVGAIVTIGALIWHVYEQFRQARMRHAAAVASAKGAKAVQHLDYGMKFHA